MTSLNRFITSLSDCCIDIVATVCPISTTAIIRLIMRQAKVNGHEDIARLIMTYLGPIPGFETLACSSISGFDTLKSMQLKHRPPRIISAFKAVMCRQIDCKPPTTKVFKREFAKAMSLPKDDPQVVSVCDQYNDRYPARTEAWYRQYPVAAYVYDHGIKVTRTRKEKA